MRNGASLSNENKKCMSLAKVAENVVEVLHDTGCNDVIVKRKLVKENDFTGSTGCVMAIDQTLKEALLLRLKWTHLLYRSNSSDMYARPFI